jgi:iron complex transport system ATP-binding protein
VRLTVNDLGVRRGSKQVLRNVSLDVPDGAVLGVLGGNGGGKSTLLGALSRLLPITGSVRVGETELSAMRREEVARTVAHMAQEFSADFEMLVYDVVMLGRTPHAAWGTSDRDHAVVMASLERVGALGLATRSFADLSGGERQRVTFARILAQDAPVLVLDEPTNHLDIAHQFDLLRLVRATGRTSVIALHDLDLAARSCDLVAVLHQGTRYAYGTPSEVLTEQTIRTVFGVHATAVPAPSGAGTRLLLDPLPRTDSGEEPTPPHQKETTA